MLQAVGLAARSHGHLELSHFQVCRRRDKGTTSEPTAKLTERRESYVPLLLLLATNVGKGVVARGEHKNWTVISI